MEKWQNAFGLYFLFICNAVAQERRQIQYSAQSIHLKYTMHCRYGFSLTEFSGNDSGCYNNRSIQVTTIQNYDNDHDSLALVTFGQKKLAFPKRIPCNNFVGFIICSARIMKPWRK